MTATVQASTLFPDLDKYKGTPFDRGLSSAWGSFSIPLGMMPQQTTSAFFPRR